MWYRKENTPAKSQYKSDLVDLVDQVFNEWGLPSSFLNDRQTLHEKLTPLMNVSESESAYQIETELPGVEKKDIKLDLHDNVLTVKGEKKGFNEEKKDKYHRIERTHGSFTRSIKLPSDIDTDKVSAKMENGVLHVEVGKHDKAKEKKRAIDIR